MILTSATVGYLGAETALFGLSFVAGIKAWQILKTWDFDKATPRQYANEKNAYLVSTVIVFLLFFKILLAVFLLYLIDSLTPFIRAAMCGVGVLNATILGWELISIKLILLALFGLWMRSDAKDREAFNYPFVSFKFKFFLLILALMAVELAFDVAVIFSLETQKVVSCCSVTFSNRNELGGFISLSRSWVGIFFTIVAVFYAFIGILGMLYVRFRLWFGVTSVAYVIVGLFFIVYTVSPYVYELPTHTCPFCIIQKEYNYIGYAFYITLLLGGFFGLRSGFSELFLGYDGRKDIGWALGFGAIFVILSLRYTLGYYLINGVWL